MPAEPSLQPKRRLLASALVLCAVGTAACGLRTPPPPAADAAPGGVAGQAGTSVGAPVDDQLSLPAPAVQCSAVERATGLRLRTPQQFEPPLCAQEQREGDLFDQSVKINSFTIIFLPDGRSKDARRLEEGDAVPQHGDELVLELLEGVRDPRLLNPRANLRRGPDSGRYITELDGVSALVSWLATDKRTSTSTLWEPATSGQWSVHLETRRSRKAATRIAEEVFE